MHQVAVEPGADEAIADRAEPVGAFGVIRPHVVQQRRRMGDVGGRHGGWRVRGRQAGIARGPAGRPLRRKACAARLVECSPGPRVMTSPRPRVRVRHVDFVEGDAMTVRTLSQANVPTTQRLAAVVSELGRIVVGKDEPLRLALACLLARGHLLIEDIPGVGKSTLAQALAAALGLKLRARAVHERPPARRRARRLHLRRSGAGLPLPSRARSSPRSLLADEINRAPPKTQSALLEAMEERQVSHRRPDAPAAGAVLRRSPRRIRSSRSAPTRCPSRSSTASSWRSSSAIPDAAAERELLIRRRPPQPHRRRIVPLADSATLLDWQREAAAIHVAPALLDYVQALLAASRGHAHGSDGDAGARRGLSPRAGLLLLAAARACGDARGTADGAARGRAGRVPVGRRPSARGRRARRRAAAAGAAARGRAALTSRSRVVARIIDRPPTQARNLSGAARASWHRRYGQRVVPHGARRPRAGGPAPSAHLHSADAARPRAHRDARADAARLAQLRACRSGFLASPSCSRDWLPPRFCTRFAILRASSSRRWRRARRSPAARSPFTLVARGGSAARTMRSC